MADGARRGRVSGPPNPKATISCSIPTKRARKRLAVLHTLRQQVARERDTPNLALADFVAPSGTGIADYVGAFALTAGTGEDEIAARFRADKDDYNAILLSALADRLAEAFAEDLHRRVRRELWGYAPDESLHQRAIDCRGLSRHQARAGLSGATRPYAKKATLFRILDAEDARRHER